MPGLEALGPRRVCEALAVGGREFEGRQVEVLPYMVRGRRAGDDRDALVERPAHGVGLNDSPLTEGRILPPGPRGPPGYL